MFSRNHLRYWRRSLTHSHAALLVVCIVLCVHALTHCSVMLAMVLSQCPGDGQAAVSSREDENPIKRLKKCDKCGALIASITVAFGASHSLSSLSLSPSNCSLESRRQCGKAKLSRRERERARQLRASASSGTQFRHIQHTQQTFSRSVSRERDAGNNTRTHTFRELCVCGADVWQR